MKKSLSLFTLLLSTFLLASCGEPPHETGPKLYVANRPNQITYNVGERLSLDGMIVMDPTTGNDVNNYTTSPSAGYEFTRTDAAAGSKSIVISASGYTSTSINVEVVDLIPLTLEGDFKKEFTVGDHFSLDGLIVKAGNTVIPKGQYTCNLSDENVLRTIGEFDVIISSDGYYSASYKIRVVATDSLYVNNMPSKTTYYLGEQFSSNGLVIKDQKNRVVSDYTLSIPDGTTLNYVSDSLNITVSKEGYMPTSFNIQVKYREVTPKEDKDITIYYVNDVHGSYMRNYVSYNKSEAGISYIGRYIKDKVKANPTTSFVLSGGDMFEGGYESNETHGQIMIDAMNSIGFDAMAIGNHEFDWGEDVLKDMVNALDCPVLGANVFYSNGIDKPDYLFDYTVVSKGNLTVGIIGAIQEDAISSIIGEVSQNFYFDEANKYIKEASHNLRLTYNCDLVFALFHDEGFSSSQSSPIKFDDLTETDLTTNRKYVDAMFFAHDHYEKSGAYNGVPYIESRCNGINVGEMKLSLTASGLNYTVKSFSTNNVNAYSTCTLADPEIEIITSNYQDIIDLGKSVVYNFKRSYTKTEFLQICCQAMIWYVNSHSSDFDNVTVNVANQNSGAGRVSSISAGELTYAEFVKAYPFDNALCIQKSNKTHIANMTNDEQTYYVYAVNGTITYVNGYTHAVTISYIAEHPYYGPKTQQSYVKYPEITAKQAFYQYLKNKIDPNL